MLSSFFFLLKFRSKVSKKGAANKNFVQKSRKTVPKTKKIAQKCRKKKSNPKKKTLCPPGNPENINSRFSSFDRLLKTLIKSSVVFSFDRPMKTLIRDFSSFDRLMKTIILSEPFVRYRMYFPSPSPRCTFWIFFAKNGSPLENSGMMYDK